MKNFGANARKLSKARIRQNVFQNFRTSTSFNPVWSSGRTIACTSPTRADRSCGALDVLSEQQTEFGHPDQLQSLKAIDDLLGTELRMKIFDLGLRAPEEIPDPKSLEDEMEVAGAEQSWTAEAALEGKAEAVASDLRETSVGDAGLEYAGQIGTSLEGRPTAPGFLNRSVSRIRTPFRAARSTPPTAFASHFGRFSRILRGHLAAGSSNIKIDGRPVGISGAVVAALSLVVLLIGAGLFIGVTQIKSLKSEITALERQLGPLKKQAASASQPEKRGDGEQNNQPPIPSSTEKGKNPPEDRPTPTGLVLSPDETRLIREYIKPAPFSGSAAPPINVGDPLTVATIPLPSPLTDKVPKLPDSLSAMAPSSSSSATAARQTPCWRRTKGRGLLKAARIGTDLKRILSPTRDPAT